MTLPPALEALDALEAFLSETADTFAGRRLGTKAAAASLHLATLREALVPARFRVSVGDHHAEIQVSQTAPAAYHQGMVETVVAEAMRRALAARPLPEPGSSQEGT
jgi:hypothetical protein